MKALLVDDEKHVRDAIRLLGHWKDFGIDTIIEAADGDEAIASITAHQPQIILSDMRMPGKDGMALLEWISVHTPHSKVLVISGYDDFELVRHAIRHGGMDYLLKPVEADELNASLLKAVTAWEEEDAVRLQSTKQSIVVNRMRPHYQDRLLTELAVGRGNGPSHLQRLQDELYLPGIIPVCSVAVTSLSHLDAGCLAKYRSQPDLLVFSVLNICAEMLSTPDEGVMFRQLDQPDEIVLLHWGPPLHCSLFWTRSIMDWSRRFSASFISASPPVTHILAASQQPIWRQVQGCGDAMLCIPNSEFMLPWNHPMGIKSGA